MKRTLKYALSAVLASAMVMPTLASAAQDNFPDVPDNHWAFEALARLKKDGLLVGYPDGLFRGGRPASRYELAVAIHAVYTNLKSVTDGLDSQIKALSDKLNGVATTQDIQNLRDALTALQNDVNGMKGYGDHIASLKKMADTFQKELQSLGVDVEAMKKDLGDLAKRVSVLEHTKPLFRSAAT
jgi:archaellum component FlaC